MRWESAPGILNDTNWNFLTAADTAGPVITDLSPANGANGVAVDANLVATFDEDIYTNTTGTIVITEAARIDGTTVIVCCSASTLGANTMLSK